MLSTSRPVRLSRRRLLLAASAVAVAGCSRTVTPPRLSDPAEPLPPIGERIGLLEDKYDATVGLYGVNLNTERALAHRDGDMFAVCSTFKAYLAARVLQLAQQGSVALDRHPLRDPRRYPAAFPAHRTSCRTTDVAGRAV